MVAAACKKHGKAWGSVSPDPEYARRSVDHGCRTLTFGGDVVAARLGLEAIKSRYAEFFGG